jgi:hypothetical protein
MADSSFVLLFCWLWTQYHTISRVCMVTTFLEFYSRVVPRPPYRQNLRPPGLAIIILKRIKHNKVQYYEVMIRKNKNMYTMCGISIQSDEAVSLCRPTPKNDGCGGRLPHGTCPLRSFTAHYAVHRAIPIPLPITIVSPCHCPLRRRHPSLPSPAIPIATHRDRAIIPPSISSLLPPPSPSPIVTPLGKRWQQSSYSWSIRLN